VNKTQETSRGLILVADDDPVWASAFSSMLQLRGYEAVTETSAKDVLRTASESNFDLITLDLTWENSKFSGIDLLGQLRTSDPWTPIVVLTSSSNVRDVVKTIQGGALDYIEKNFDRDKTMLIIANSIELGRLRRQNNSFLQELRDKYDIKGNSQAIQTIMANIRRFGPSESTVLITGETGTGKLLVAGQIHYYSKRRDKKLVRLDMNLTPRDLVDSMLFGHRKGAFSGAIEDRKGLVEEANGGTLFLDEISDASPDLQAKLKTLVDNKVFRRVGENEERIANVRIIAATNRNLPELVSDGKFFEDLYYRLKAVEVRLPPLRDRKEDIPILAQHFARQESLQQLGYERLLSPEALSLLLEHDWPGNVRELRLSIQAALVCSEPGNEITPDDLTGLQGSVFQSRTSVAAKPLKVKMSEFQRVEIIKAMNEAEGKVERAAKLLSMDRTTLYRYLAEFELKHLIA